MATVSLHGFQPSPGRAADHMAAAQEAIGHLRRLGLQAMLLQPIAGGDVGTTSTIINYADNAGYAAAMQAIGADEQWQEFWARVSADGAAVPIENTLLNDLDADFQPSADRPLGVGLATQWRAKDGRLVEFLGKVAESQPIIERLGGVSRAMQCLVGRYPMTIMVATWFADLDAYGAYADRTNTDAEWQAFWGGALADPTADLIRSGVYLNISDG